MDESFEVQVPTDAEGYLALLCPHCGGPFKIRGADYQSRELLDLYCANCGLSDEFSAFLPPDVLDAIRQAALDLFLPDLEKAMAGLKRVSSGGLISINAELKLPPPPPELRAITDLAEADVPCCETAVKLPFGNAATVFYCPFCRS